MENLIIKKKFGFGQVFIKFGVGRIYIGNALPSFFEKLIFIIF